MNIKKEKTMIVDINRFRELSRRTQAGLAAVVLIVVSIVPVLLPGSALAAPTLTERELQSTSAVPNTTTDLTWIFDTTSDVANIDYIEIQFCDSPLGTCTTNNTPSIAGSPTATLTNFTSNGVTATSLENGLGGGTNNQIQIDKTTVDAGASLNEATISLAPTDITNDTTATGNLTYYTRVRVYSDTGTTLVWEGVFAQSTSQTLTVNARVQERLDFCVGSTTVDDATTTVGAACANVTGSNVDIGNIESGNNNISPVDVANGGDDENGVAMVRTNAVNGVVVDYRALLNTSSGALKVAGASCGAVPSVTGTDQCFNTSATQSTLVAGTEEFGMTVAGINCGSVTAYTCDFLTAGGGGVAGTDYNMQRDAEFDGSGAGVYTTDANQVAGTSNAGYAWDATGAVDRIASSAASTVKVVDDEAMILKFAATAGITTPTGSYTVQADFIATATF